MQGVVDFLNGIVWNQWFIFAIVVVGAGFTVAFGFLQVRHFRLMWRELRESARAATGIAPVQALLISLSARLGTGNIAGVATAIAMGGPGAVVWMWIAALLGMATAFAEGTLAQAFKERRGSEYHGGPGFYLSRGTGINGFGVAYAVVITLAFGIFIPGTQSNSITQVFEGAWHIPTWLGSLIVVGLMVLISAGGVKRFATFSDWAVPFAAGIYCLTAVVVLVANAAVIPSMIQLMFASAFGSDAALGGLLGTAVAWGVKRGVYSNEAGEGTAAHAAAAAHTTHPAKQGLIQSLGVFIDTIMLCSATALMMLVTDSYNVVDPDGGFLVEHLPGTPSGAAFPQAAVDSLLPGVGGSLIAVIVFFFAFTTLLYYVFTVEMNLKRLLGDRKVWRWVTIAVISVVALYGGMQKSELVWALGDLGVGLNTWVNMTGLVVLTPVTLKILNDYRKQRKQGLNPSFDPRRLGIERAVFWEEEVDSGRLTLNDLDAAGEYLPARPDAAPAGQAAGAVADETPAPGRAGGD